MMSNFFHTSVGSNFCGSGNNNCGAHSNIAGSWFSGGMIIMIFLVIVFVCAILYFIWRMTQKESMNFRAATTIDNLSTEELQRELSKRNSAAELSAKVAELEKQISELQKQKK